MRCVKDWMHKRRYLKTCYFALYLKIKTNLSIGARKMCGPCDRTASMNYSSHLMDYLVTFIKVLYNFAGSRYQRVTDETLLYLLAETVQSDPLLSPE